MLMILQKDLKFSSMRRVSSGRGWRWSLWVRPSRCTWVAGTAVQRTSLDTAAAPCVAQPGYSLSACMEEHLAARAGCRLDWADSSQGENHQPCSTWDQIFRYQTLLTDVRSEELLDEHTNI